METIKTVVLQGSAIALALLILASLLRAVLGPRFTDRIIAVNVINTLVVAEIVLLSVLLSEEAVLEDDEDVVVPPLQAARERIIAAASSALNTFFML